ncbi:MAG: lysophospholipase [Bdellovibrionales bacterium]|nr:lysophospholipase [Bdellovibrionales bacterium]
MSEQYESTFHGYQHAEIFYNMWRIPNPVATILITHGLAEHSECYKELAEDLNKLNYNVIAYDLRGHGRTEGARGVIEDFDIFSQDLLLFIEHCQKNYQNDKPFFLFGHSLGGLITAKTILQYSITDINAVVFSAPCFGLKVDVPAWKEKLAKLTSQWLPNMTLWNELRYEDLVRDPAKIKSYESDPLRHDKISPRLFLGMLNAIEFIKNNETDFDLPLLMQVAGNDRICNSSTGIRFYENCSSTFKKLQIYDESLHEIYNDLDRQIAIRDLQSFLLKFIKPSEKEKTP